ncbi:MAG: MFS transporter [Acetobacteraceae bacterium]|nr:MFS transporter [Acetobacteraceae bacterium]
MIDRRWVILGVLFVARTAMGFQYQTIGSSTPYLMDALGIGFTEIGTLIGLYHIAGVFLSLPGGLIIQRFGDKRICACGLTMMAAGGMLIAVADRYGVAIAGRLVSGIGGILFNIVITKMTADWFARREIVLAMAVILSTWPFGIALGLFTQPLIAALFGWRIVMLLSASMCVASLVLVSLFYRVPAAEPSVAAPAARGLGLPAGRVLAPVIVAGLIWGSFNAGLVGYFSFVPLLLVERGGTTLAAAGAMTSLALWVGMLSISAGGFVAQRLRRPGATIVLFSGAAAASLAAIVAGAPPLVACLAFGLAIGPPPGVITSLPTRVLSAADRAAGFGVFYTCHSLLQASGPAIVGWVHDHAGGGAAVGYAAAMFLVPLPLLVVFEVAARRARQGDAVAR